MIVVLLVISSLPILQAWNNRNTLLNDDSLITLTFARNLGEGTGFIYNAQPAILGTTTPLWTLLCALGHYILPAVPLTRLAVLLSGLFWLAAIWLLFVFRQDFLLQPLALLATAAIISSLNWPEALGMEAFLFVFLMLLSCGLFSRGRFFWSGFFAALLFLTRGEGILLLGIQLASLPLRQIFQKKRFDMTGMLRILAGFAIPFFAWAAYALPTFHQILPNTLGIKIAQARSGLWPSFWQRFWSDWLPNFRRNWQLASPWLNIWIILFLLGLIVMIRKRRPLCMVLAWLGFYFAGYSLLRVAAYSWYMFPIAWISGLAVAEAVAFLSTLLGKWRSRFFRDGWASWGVILIFIAAVMIPVARTTKSYHPHPKCQTYLEICRWFERNASPSQSVAFFEVGYLGFYTRNPVVDQMGLVTPGSASAIARRDFSSIFWLHNPDYLLVYNGSGFQYQIVSDPRFPKNYSPVATFAGWGENSLIMFKHR
jgi:hypothetical protein